MQGDHRFSQIKKLFFPMKLIEQGGKEHCGAETAQLKSRHLYGVTDTKQADVQIEHSELFVCCLSVVLASHSTVYRLCYSGCLRLCDRWLWR